MFTEQWETVMSDIGDESEKKFRIELLVFV